MFQAKSSMGIMMMFQFWFGYVSNAKLPMPSSTNPPLLAR